MDTLSDDLLMKTTRVTIHSGTKLVLMKTTIVKEISCNNKYSPTSYLDMEASTSSDNKLLRISISNKGLFWFENSHLSTGTIIIIIKSGFCLP